MSKVQTGFSERYCTPKTEKNPKSRFSSPENGNWGRLTVEIGVGLQFSRRTRFPPFGFRNECYEPQKLEKVSGKEYRLFTQSGSNGK